MNVLLVEDNEADRRAVKEAFGAICKQANLHTVDDGDAALQVIFKRNGFPGPAMDLVMLDLNLPGTNGFEVLKEVKSNPGTRNIPVIIFSSSCSERDINLAYQSNANCYLSKPMRYSELLKTIEKICEFWVKEVKYSRGE